jgi:phosphoesterase RecJ-like protein
VKVTRAVAEAVFTCILTDTGRFRFSNTNVEAMRLCGELLELGADPKAISDALYASYSEAQLRMLGELLAGMEIHHDGASCLLIQNQDIRTRYSDGHPEIESLSDYTIYTRGVKIGALLREIDEERTKVSLRCHDPYDVSAIAEKYGGGGHRNAAGCVIDKPLTEARNEIIKLIEDALNEVPNESDEQDERVSAGR